jgi:hypothetical protein
MRFRIAYLITALVASVLTIPVSSEAAGPSVLQVKFNYDGIANCEQPLIRNFPIHGDGTGSLSVDRTARLEVNVNGSEREEYKGTLGGAPTAAPGGSAAIGVVGRHTLRVIRDFPNNTMVINITVRRNGCSMMIENRLKRGARQYTFYNASGAAAYCSRPQIIRTECAAY